MGGEGGCYTQEVVTTPKATANPKHPNMTLTPCGVSQSEYIVLEILCKILGCHRS